MTAINDRADGALRFIHPAAAALAATLRAEAAVSPSARRPYSCHMLRARGRRDPPVPALRAAPAPRPAPGPLRPAPLIAVGARPRAVPPREAVGDPPGALHSLRGGGGFSSARRLPTPSRPRVPRPPSPRSPRAALPSPSGSASRPSSAAVAPWAAGGAVRFRFRLRCFSLCFAGCGFSRAFPAGRVVPSRFFGWAIHWRLAFYTFSVVHVVHGRSVRRSLFFSAILCLLLFFPLVPFLFRCPVKTPRLFSVRLLLFTRFSPGALRAQPALG